MREQLVAHEPAVHVDELRVAGSARVGGRPGEAGEFQNAVRFDRAHRLRELRAQRRLDPLRGVCGREPRRDSAVVPQGKCDIGPRQDRARKHLLAVGEFGGIALQELAPRRGVVIELIDFDRGPGGLRRGLHSADAPGFGAEGKGVGRSGGAARHDDARDRGDARQRLAAKAERADLLEILERGDLAGRMPGEGHRQIVLRDA